MEIRLDSHLSATYSASQMSQVSQKIDCNSSITECSDAAPQSSGCCLCTILDAIVECFNALLVCLGLKETTIDRLLKDPIAFLKLLSPSNEDIDQASPLINSTNSNGETLLFLLCEKEGKTIDLPDGEKLTITHEIIKHVLTKEKPKIELRHFAGYSVLHCVKSAATASLILDQAPALINAKDNDRRTPLHMAAIYGNSEVAQCLIARNSEVVWARNLMDATPLHLAATVEVAKVILTADNDLLVARNNPASIWAKDPPENPMEQATAYGYDKVATFLKGQYETFQVANLKMSLEGALKEAVRDSEIIHTSESKRQSIDRHRDHIKRCLDIAKARIDAGEDFRTLQLDKMVSSFFLDEDLPDWKIFCASIGLKFNEGAPNGGDSSEFV